MILRRTVPSLAAAIIIAGSAGCSSSSSAITAEPGGDAAIDGSIGQMNVDAGPAIRADRFVVTATLTTGACGGFGATGLPDVVKGPPEGGGDGEGSLDVVSLGTKGSIVLGFGANAIVDGDGVDFLVFENSFLTNGQPDFELGEVSVSEDGATWKTFPCTATGVRTSGYGMCAGWHPVESSSTNGISPIDVAHAGGDPFDLKDVGLAKARFVRITDTGIDYESESCATGSTTETNGFDLDAVAIVNAMNE